MRFDCAGSHKVHGWLYVSWQAQYFVDLDAKAAETRNPLVTLHMSNRSGCGAVRILLWLAQPFRHFARVGLLSLWREEIL